MLNYVRVKVRILSYYFSELNLKSHVAHRANNITTDNNITEQIADGCQIAMSAPISILMAVEMLTGSLSAFCQDCNRHLSTGGKKLLGGF